MDRNLFVYLSQISTYAAVVPLVISFFIFRRFNLIQKRLLLLVVVLFLTEIISTVLWSKNINNNPLFHIYTIIEFTILVKIYQSALANYFRPIFLNGLIAAFIIFAICNVIWLQSLFEFNSNVTIVSCLLCILLPIFYFYSLLKDAVLSRLDLNPMFWISFGLLIYFSTNLITFYLNQDLMLEDRYTIWGIHSVVNTVLVIFYIVALWVKPKMD
jgi:hypothetical protein